MDKKALQSYAVWAKTNLENQIEVQLKTLGINSEKDIKTARKVGDRTIIDGDSNSYPGDLKEKRDQIVRLIQEDGYKQVIEEFAYTWFNRIVALRFMEVHDFLPHGFRVLSSRTGGFEPEIMKNLNFVKGDLKLDLSVISPLLEQGKIDEAYRYVLFRQCNALSGILPMLFSSEQSYLELLLPKALLKGETFITKLLEIGEDDFLNDVEVIGWLYQFYISQKKDAVFASKETITKDTLPAVTQLFTPDWIVRYMAENSVGRIWMESYPNSSLKSEMKYYVEDAEQDEDVQRKINEIKYKNVNPEDIRIIEPCCGSGHILVYVFDLLYKMYEEKGYAAREIPTLILKKNLVGLDVDKRAAQLASFSLIMKARSVNSRFFNDTYYVIPEVYEIWDSRALLHCDYKTQLQEMKLLSTAEMDEIEWLVKTFRYAKTIGSLLKVVKKDFASIESTLDKINKNAVSTIFNTNFLNEGMECLRHLLRQAEVMSSKYDVMITNPPYIGISSMEQPVKDYATKEYPNSKTDMFAMFMETDFVKKNGFFTMINMQSWMFLASYSSLRSNLILNKHLVNMIHLGASAFESIAGEVMQPTAFVIRNQKNNKFNSKFYRETEVYGQDNKQKDFLLKIDTNYYVRKMDDFACIKGSPICYWASSKAINLFKNKSIDEICSPRCGLKTGITEKYVMTWQEVNFNDIGFNYPTRTSAKDSKKKWFPVSDGQEFRKWYGNNYDVVFWENDGYEIRNLYMPNGKLKSRPQNMDYYFKKGITWSALTSKNLSLRLNPLGNIISGAGYGCFNQAIDMNPVMGLLNSKVAAQFSRYLSGTLNFEVGVLARIPVSNDIFTSEISSLVDENVSLAKRDWDLYERSWDFQKSPLLRKNLIKDAVQSTIEECQTIRKTIKQNEQTLNKLFIDIYDLADELSPEIDETELTIDIPSNNMLVANLISYLIGVEMGRYSLDVDGLAYAGGEWNPMNYVTYQPDDDGIIPIYTQLGMADGLTGRIIKLIKHIYGEDTYKENIDFIADALGKKSNESSEETLNRYLNDGFYADHLKTYQKRPIYWMFSSGKNGAFKCLVYLHRYNEDTLARINSKYFLNESARLNAEVNDTAVQLETAESKEKLRLDKVYKTLTAKQKEMLEYGWVLDHMANKYIPLDLDDGVKVNYAKFQGIEIVNDNGVKVKKDLLTPIK